MGRKTSSQSPRDALARLCVDARRKVSAESLDFLTVMPKSMPKTDPHHSKLHSAVDTQSSMGESARGPSLFAIQEISHKTLNEVDLGCLSFRK